MAFSLSYRSLNEQNIRHIYSDQKLRFVFRKRNTFRPLKEELPIPPLRLYPKRFYDYYPAYHIGIPRAPAFRGTDQERVERIVKRICKPIQCQKERRRDLNEEENPSQSQEKEKKEREEKEEDDEVTSSIDSKRAAKDMKLLIARLQKPTQSWEKKKYNPADRKIKEEESSIPKLPPIPARC